MPAYLKIEYRTVPRYQRIASLLTVHNLAFQGQFWHWDMLLTGFDWKYFNWRQMEFHGKLNLLKTGMVFADSINTVSPRYAAGDSDQPLGLRAGRACCSIGGTVLSGILNGMDPARVEPGGRSAPGGELRRRSVAQGKPVCKAALQKELGLPQRADVPLVASISRMTEQKGFDLIAEVLQRWVQTADAQWVILGTGQPKYHRLFESLAQRYPDKMALRQEFSNPLSHRIEAGADMFLMPSRFEPCGLNQFYSLKYGTVPVVRATGGLADTIVGFGQEKPGGPPPNGFSFAGIQPVGLERDVADGLRRLPPARDMAATDRRGDAAGLVVGGQRRQYVDLYQKTTLRSGQLAMA